MTNVIYKPFREFESRLHSCDCTVSPPSDKSNQRIEKTPLGWVCNVCHAIIHGVQETGRSH